MTGVHEEVTYCSPSTSSGKQKKNHLTSQPQLHSENTPATIEAEQVLSELQQLASNNNSANFRKNINRIFKLPKSLTTTMPTFDGKSEKFELFENLFQTSLRIHNQLTEEDRINYFHSLMRGDALQTVKNINSPTGENLGEILALFLKKIRKTPIDGDNGLQIPETCLQPSKWEVRRFFWWASKTGQIRIRNCFPRHHWTIRILQNATTPKEIKTSGPLRERHIQTHSYTPRKTIGAERFWKPLMSYKEILRATILLHKC